MILKRALFQLIREYGLFAEAITSTLPPQIFQKIGRQFIIIHKYYHLSVSLKSGPSLPPTFIIMMQAQTTPITEGFSPTVIESMCVQCGENGETVLLMTKVPFFRELLIGSFRCEHCGNRNNQVQFCGQLPSHGVKIVFKAMDRDDLNREIIRSEHASLYFKELDLEIPPTGKAQITTLQGILVTVEEELQGSQEARKNISDGDYLKIEEFLSRLKSFKDAESFPFQVILTDPSGNSNIKNPHAPKLDHKLLITHTTRRLEDLEKMGYSYENGRMEGQKGQKTSEIEKEESEGIEKKEQSDGIEMEQSREGYSEFKTIDFNKGMEQQKFLNRQATIFEIDCHVCLMPGEMKMCQTSIPHFSDIVIMSFSCEYCGAHSTDTKNSGEASDHCLIFTLKANSQADLKRDIYKSETCKVNIPELDLELDYGTLGGAYTTVDGLLEKIKSHISQMNSFTDSDSDFWMKITELVGKIDRMISGELGFTLVLTDPLSHSFLQNPHLPEEDPNVTITSRPRNEEENDYLGFSDMVV